MIILLTGPNDFAIHHAMQALTTDFVRKYGAHALEKVDGEMLDASRLPDLLIGSTLFAAKRLVILRGASKSKPLWDVLADWFERVSSDTVFILVEQNPDKRTRTYKQLQKYAQIREFAELSERELANWTQDVVRESGIELDAKVGNYIVALVGTDQWRLYSELQKLISAGQPITVEVVNELVEPNPQASAFDLLDSVLNGDRSRAAQLVARLKTSEDAYRLFALLVSQVQTLALVVTGHDKSSDTIAKEAGVHPFVVRKMQSLARTLDYSRLQSIIAVIAHTDTQLKSSGVEPWTLLEQCFNKVAARGA